MGGKGLGKNHPAYLSLFFPSLLIRGRFRDSRKARMIDPVWRHGEEYGL